MDRRAATRWWIAGLGALILALRLPFAVADGPLAPLVGPGTRPAPPWRVIGMPAQRKPLTRFQIVPLDGERVLRVEADHSYANLVHATRIDGGERHLLSWRWRVDDGLPEADLRRRASEDVPIRVCALFDLPLAAVPFIERQLLRAVRLGADDDPPSASVCYVWDAHLAPGTALASPFTRRIRYIVLHGPETPLHAWRAEERDVGADLLNLFGDEARVVPPMIGVAIGADADNTHGYSQAHVVDVDLH